jgi:NAD(P)-dependent dehydrogenase (short-subunit alcohol dehydrogenase family)
MEMTDLFLRNSQTNVIVTGGSQGIGFATARRLVQEGAKNIALVGRNSEKGAKAAEKITALGANCTFLKADVSNPDDCNQIVSRALDAFGSVNALVNAAADTSRGTLQQTTPDIFDRLMRTNVLAPLLLSKDLIAHLTDTGKPGSIVNVLSLVALCGQSYLTAYSTSKGALATLTKNIANAHAWKKIRCNGVMTGWMDTPGEDATMRKYHGATDGWLKEAEAGLPMGQLVKPNQLASLIAYMVSPESGVMTGSLVEYDQIILGAYPEEELANS